MEKKEKKKLDFYFVLEVEKKASQEEIKSAYKKLALVSNYKSNMDYLEMASRQKWEFRREHRKI